MQITEHIHALKIPFSVPTPQGNIPRFVYVYLIYGEEICLIDSAVASSENVIFDYLRNTGKSPEDISLTILTHSHPDHIGAAQAVKRASGCRVAAHHAEKAWIEDVALQAKERPVPGFHSLVGGSVEVDRTIQDGDIVDLGDGRSLKVIHTPGHSRGSISLFLPDEGALFSADAVPLAGDMPIYEDILESAASIRRLKAIDGIELLLAAWDDSKRGERAYQTLDEGLRYLQLIHDAVLKVSGKSGGNVESNAKESGEPQQLDPMELCCRTLRELGMPEVIANPIIARSFQSSLSVRDKKICYPGREVERS